MPGSSRLALLVALGLSVAACGSSHPSSSTTSARSTTSTSSGSASTATTSSSTAPTSAPAPQSTYSSQLRSFFLSSCDRTSNGKLAYCRCTLSHIERLATQARFEADVRALIKGTAALPRYVTDSEHACGA